MAKFKVIRAHQGNKWYNEGEIREAREDHVKHLIGKCLEAVPEKKNSEKPANKSAPAVKDKAG